jgi:hypothetical protein
MGEWAIRVPQGYSLVSTIGNKTISFSDKTVQFSDSNWMAPAIWLDVPNDWRNKYTA